MKKQNQFSPEVKERAVWLVQEHRQEYPSLWAAVESIAPRIGCVPSTLLDWVKRAEIHQKIRPGLSTNEGARIKVMEREIKELCRASGILKTASAFFAQAAPGVRRDKRLRITMPDQSRPCPQDLVLRQFAASRPNQLWVADFTYVSTRQGW